jgi:hypothetical protein
MIKLKIEGNSYDLPTAWSDCNIKQYVAIQNILATDESDMKKLIMVIAALTDCPMDVLYNVSVDDIGKLDISWMAKDIKSKTEKIIEIDGKKYGVIKDMKNLTLGEYVDLDHFIKDAVNNMHKICAVLMRPVISQDGELYIIEKYDGKIDERANIFFNKMNVVQLHALTSFFMDFASGYLRSTSPSLQQLAKKSKKMKK